MQRGAKPNLSMTCNLRLCIVASLAIVQQTFGAPRTSENQQWNINFETRHVPSEYYGEWEGHTYFPSPEDWRSLPVYQLMTDRFVDGDPHNNQAARSGFDVRDMTFRHGGDFKGVTEKLPYIKGLGCQAIWISPVFQNGDNYYHQYAQEDFTLLDRRLGTLEELRALTSAAHALGMYIIIDVVMNHMGNEFYFDGHEHSQAPFRFHHGEYWLRTRRNEAELKDTPVGKQPYADFWYNNTWDKDAHYQGTVYGWYGESNTDDGHLGSGTYSGSDFHHNGDLEAYTDIWGIHLGKLYGTMDDLRLESERVQDKYIAMTKALIASADVDGFRVDTPMQVPLSFYKRWCPEIRAYAASLGKTRFGIWGEFYTMPARYATMTGRGKDQHMRMPGQYIDDVATMKGGIVYAYYWYMFTAMVHERPEYSNGFALAYEEEGKMLDIYDPTTQRNEFAMWNFCNNHDNWRMQAMTGTRQMHMCLAVITFFPGMPVHYAGDEQDLNSPGSALDGWAREELSVSMAWRSLRTTPDGNPADRDNFDMTSSSYQYISRLNALRRAYFSGFGFEMCDQLDTPQAEIADMLVFTRACNESSRVAVIANFHTHHNRTAAFSTGWSQGTVLRDTIATEAPLVVVVGAGGAISVELEPLGVVVLAAGVVKAVPPTVVAVTPGHGTVASWKDCGPQVTLAFDRDMKPETAASATFDGQTGFVCSNEGCSEITMPLNFETVGDGVHVVEVPQSVEALDGMTMFSPFRSAFIVDSAAQPNIVADPDAHLQVGLICQDMRKLCHRAHGADWMRMKNEGDDWTYWEPYKAESDWNSYEGRPVLAQYHVAGSSSYIAGDCVGSGDTICSPTWYQEMFVRGGFNDWGRDNTTDNGRMTKVDSFTWGRNITFHGFQAAKFVPARRGWANAFGSQPDRELVYGLPSYDDRNHNFHVPPYKFGTEASRKWMQDRGFWDEHQSLATAAEWSSNIWVDPSCTAVGPQCRPSNDPADLEWKPHGFTGTQDMAWCQSNPVEDCVEYKVNDFSPAMNEACRGFGCCRRAFVSDMRSETGPSTCCVLFNDLLLNYTITPDLSRCSPAMARTRPHIASLTATTTPSSVAAPCPLSREVHDAGSRRLSAKKNLRGTAFFP